MGEYADSLSKSKTSKVTDTARENRNAQRDAASRAAALKQTRKEDKEDVLRAKKAAGKVVIAPSKTTTITPPTGGGSGSKRKSDIKEEAAQSITSAPIETGIVNNLNVKEEYRREARRIILSLVESAKSLLIKYNFSSINRVPSYVLDSDNEAKSEYVISERSRPEPPFTLNEAAMQDRFSQDISSIANSIGDMVDDATKLAYFGTLQGGVLIPGKPKISNGISSYDMKLTINSISDKTFVIKCYEIS